MRNRFDRQLVQLNDELIEMGSMIEKAIREAITALIKQDTEAAKKIIVYDEDIDQQEKTIENLCLKLLLQQQRICIARALAVDPEVLLMDEATSALDPISTSKIEDLTMELKDKLTIVMVTHNMQQAVRVSDQTVFFLLGEIIEYGDTQQIFSMPKEKKTEDYITGRFG